MRVERERLVTQSTSAEQEGGFFTSGGFMGN